MKVPPKTPTKDDVGKKVKLRGRLATGELVAFWDETNPAMVKILDNEYPLSPAITVAWDWESYDLGLKLVHGYMHPFEVELIEDN